MNPRALLKATASAFRNAGIPDQEVDAALLLAYWLIWVVCWRRGGLFRAAMLSALPSALFLFSGVAARNYPLLAAALVFAPCHICISCKNAPVIR